MKTKSIPGNMDLARIPTAVSYGPDAPSLDADMGSAEDMDPATGRDIDEIPAGGIELMPIIDRTRGGVTHEGDMGRLSN